VTGGTTTDDLVVTGTTTTNGINNGNGGITFAGAVSGVTNLTGTGAGSISGFVNVTATGTVEGGTLSDGAGTTITGGTVATNTVTAGTGNITTVNSTTINNTGTTTTRTLAVGTGGMSVAAGAPVDMGGNRVQNVATPIVATDAANKGYVDGLNAMTNDRVNQAFRQIDENTEGIAVAIAMGGLTLPQGKDFALGANVGFYDDKQAAAAQAAIRLNEVVSFNAGVGVGFDNNKVGGRVGFMAAW
jgi:hypothetical protein